MITTAQAVNTLGQEAEPIVEQAATQRWIARFIQTAYNGHIVRSMDAVVEASSTTRAYDAAYERIALLSRTEAGWMLDGVCPID